MAPDLVSETDPRILAISQQRLSSQVFNHTAGYPARPDADDEAQNSNWDVLRHRIVGTGEGDSWRKIREGQSNARGASKRELSFSKSAADYFVPSLPGIPNLSTHPTHPLTVHAGLIPSYPGPSESARDISPSDDDDDLFSPPHARQSDVDPTGVDAQIFFLMISSRRSAGRSRLVFWFNGGPGCSSFDGALMEVGPFRTVPAGKGGNGNGQVELRLVEGGWEEFATIVFVDQPPGTGLSVVPTNGYLHELDESSAHLIKFIDNFYQIFPEYKGVDTYLAGESFAGQYIPYFADALMKSDKIDVPLKGITIGNGWIDPREQYQGYADFAYIKGLIKPDTKESAQLDSQAAICKMETDQYEDGSDMPINMASCGGVMASVTRPFTQDLNGKKVCMNIYDTRLVDDWPACGMNWPPDLPDIYLYLRRDDVLRALHAESRDTAWVECSNTVSSQLHLRRSPASVNLLPGILKGGVKIMLFAGDEDLICNYVGIERTIARLNWGGEQGLGNATTEEWYVNGTYAGSWRTARDLTYVAAASHMVGVDVPHVTNDMIIRFMDVDMEELLGVTSVYASSLGGSERPQLTAVEDGRVILPVGGNRKLDIGTYASAGSFFGLVLLVSGAVGLYFYLRRRSRLRRSRLALSQVIRRDEEENVPLGRGETHEMGEYSDEARANGNGANGAENGKTTAKAFDEDDAERQVVFELGDED